MLSQTLGLSAVLALAADALLLPPGISSASTETGNALLIHPNHHTVQVECDACPLGQADPERGIVWTEGIANSLVFQIDTGAHKDVLNINGAQMFPPTLSLIPEALYVHQVPADAEVGSYIEHNPRLRVTGYEFRFDAGEIITEEGNELLPMTFTIHSIAGLSVPQQTLRIFVVKDIEGNLGVAHVNSVQASNDDVTLPEELNAECKKWPMLCKLKDVVSSKIHGMKNSFRKGGCPKMNGMPSWHGRPSHHHARPHGGPAQFPHDAPHHHHQHQHHRHGKLHRFMHIIGRVVLSILIPVLVGIAAGIATYLVGMVLGATIALIWMKIRGRQSQYQPIALDDEEASNADLKEVFAKEAHVIDEIAEVEGEAPPAYTDLDEKEVANSQN